MGMSIGDYAKVRRTSGVWKLGRVIDTGTTAGGLPFIKFRFTTSTKVISAPYWDSQIRPLRVEEATNIPFMGMYIGDYAKVRRTSGVWQAGRVIDTGTTAGGLPFIKFRFSISTKVISAPNWDGHIRPLRDAANVSSSRPATSGPASCAPPTRVVTREADGLKGAGAEKSSTPPSNRPAMTTLTEALGTLRDDLAVPPAKPVEPSSRDILPTTPAKAPTNGSSNRASPSSKRATGWTIGGGYHPNETEGYVYWAAFTTNDLRAPRCDRGSRGFPSPQKGARGPPQRDKRHWVNPSYRVVLPIDDGEPPSQHLWNNNDGAGIKVMSLAPQVYGNYNTMGTGTDPSLLIMILLMVQRTSVNWATFGGMRLDIPCFALLCSSLVCAVANCGCNSLGTRTRRIAGFEKKEQSMNHGDGGSVPLGGSQGRRSQNVRRQRELLAGPPLDRWRLDTPPIRLVSAPNAAWMKVYHSNGGRCVQTDSLRRQRHRIGIALACFDTSHHVFELLGHRLSDIADEAAVGYDAVNAAGSI
ncbi:hypothetical protein THAOC_15819 [Thalassiosira oceanica]|uniref:Uncharacterized protein n=1 Tax=Thalassiosira oceanica TaxID=159749 RepID=K0SBJ8_THAOC|nr:hypothetical protein THAOC_15819 [Thalassiosira oceanica]|eukprot:EJK63518.1 hypothetical protein THAOC_15819 [Thalassiosira oceanica]